MRVNQQVEITCRFVYSILKTKLTNIIDSHLKIFAITDTQWFVETITGTWT